MIKFFHTADFHIGVENYGKIDPKTGLHSRLLDFQESLKQIKELAIKEKIDFLLFCGDAYKTAFPSPTQQKILLNYFIDLQQAGIPVISVVGNHDHPLTFGKANSLDILESLPVNGFYLFTKPDILKLETKNGPIQIVGIPWPTRNNLIANTQYHHKDYNQITDYISQGVSQIIKNLAEKLDPKIPAILAGHLTVSTGIFSGSEKCAIFGNDPIFLPSQLAINPFDYVALGHLHRYQNLNAKGYPAVIYSGSIERVDFGERNEEKGFCCIKIDPEKTKSCSYNFIKLQTRPMLQLEINLEEQNNQTEKILDFLEINNIKDSIVKLIYSLPENIQDKVDLPKIENYISSQAHYFIITTKRTVIKREERINLKIEMGFNDILEKYFDSKNIDNNKKNLLLNKTKELQEELEVLNTPQET